MNIPQLPFYSTALKVFTVETWTSPFVHLYAKQNAKGSFYVPSSLETYTEDEQEDDSCCSHCDYTSADLNGFFTFEKSLIRKRAASTKKNFTS